MSDISQRREDPRADGTSSPLTPTAFYRDPRAALDWLGRAFGFEVGILMVDANGDVAYAEMTYRGASIGVAGEWTIDGEGAAVEARSPASMGGAITQFVWIDVGGDVDAHCERARSAGALIIQEPADQFYGARTYRALDPEGHVWNFRQELRRVSPAEMEQATGLRFEHTGR